MLTMITQKKQLISPPNFSLVEQENGLKREEIRKCISYLRNYFQFKSSSCVGYPVNSDFDYSLLFDFLNFNINNVGDPYINSNYAVNSRMAEQPVLDFFAHLFHAADRNYWGYVASGGTEANMYGLYNGRVFLESPSKPSFVDRPTPIAYFSEDTHYSIQKALRMLKVPYKIIPSTVKGSIQVSKLMEAILQSDLDTHPPLIAVTLGTTFKGAYDDVEEISNQLQKYQIERFYIHVDAALGGLFLPFLEEHSGASGSPQYKGHKVPIFDFRLPVGSIAVSGHKMIGTPCPCAIFMALKENMAYEWEKIDYIGTFDSTLSGSRNGLAAILLWYAIAARGVNGFREQALRMLDAAEYATQRIQATGFNAWKNDLGLSVVFDRPPEWLVHKWSLATVGDYAHLFAMGHVTRRLVDRLAKDLEKAKQSSLGSAGQRQAPRCFLSSKPASRRLAASSP